MNPRAKLWDTLGWLAFLAGAAGMIVGCAHEEVRADEMSSEAHRREAANLRAHADGQAALYDPTLSAPLPATSIREAPPYFPVAIYAPFNPTMRHLYKAQDMAQHAQAHEQAAAELEAYEDKECGEFPSTTRAACPVLGPVRVEDLPNGVRLHLPAQMPVDATVEHMRCHLAYARARGFAPSATCPLYLRGTQVRRAPGLDAVDLVSEDPATVGRLQKLARGDE